MRKYVETFMENQFFPADAREELISVYDKIMADDALCDILCRAIDLYENDITCDYDEVLALCEELEESSLIHEYMVNLIFCICLTFHLKDRYNKAGIGQDVWSDTVSELKYKMIECKDRTNIWGIKDKESLRNIFEMKCFTLGRLQFEPAKFGDIVPSMEYDVNGTKITSDTKDIKVLVPRMLRQLDSELLEESYAMAKDFFADEFTGMPMTLVCKSWMLYPEFAGVGYGTDIKSFSDGFELAAVSDDAEGEYPDMVEVFDMEFTGRAEDYPENTMLRKHFKEYLINGGKTGRGIGIKIL